MAGLGDTYRSWRSRRWLGDEVASVLARPDGRVAELGQELRDPHVVQVDHGLAGWVRHGRLAGAGPFDLLVDSSSAADRVVDLFRESFLHVRAGGRYVVLGESAAALAAFLETAETSPLTMAVGEVRRTGDALSVVRTGRTLAKLREREMNEALAQDPSRGRVLSSLPGVAFDSACEMRVSRPPLRDQTKERYEAPELFLREYDEVSCRPKSVLVQRGLLCPDTYRHHLAPHLTHKMLRDSAPRFAVTPKNEPPSVRLEGTYFHLDNEIRGFFGHALTEQVSRLWAWREAQERHPGIKVLLSLNRGREVAGWEYELLEAGGIDRADVVVISEPVVVERLLSATPMFSMPAYVAPAHHRDVGRRRYGAARARGGEGVPEPHLLHSSSRQARVHQPCGGRGAVRVVRLRGGAARAATAARPGRAVPPCRRRRRLRRQRHVHDVVQ